MKKIGMKKIALISLALVLALGSLGLGYAHWSDQLYVEGDVSSGTVTLAWDISEEPFLGYTDNEPPEKDTAWGEIYYDHATYVQDPCSLKEGYKNMVLTVHEAYPCYEIHFTTVRIHNIGTIPVILTGFDVYDPTGELNFTWTVPPPASPAVGYFWKDFNGDGVCQLDDEEVINFEIVNFVGTQLHACESVKGEVDLHFKQPMEQCHTYYFSIDFGGVQWNKYEP